MKRLSIFFVLGSLISNIFIFSLSLKFISCESRTTGIKIRLFILARVCFVFLANEVAVGGSETLEKCVDFLNSVLYLWACVW